MHHLHEVQTLAQTLYDHDHSNDQGGSNHEDVPEWAHWFFRLFEAIQNQETSNERAAIVRNDRSSVVSSLVGCQALLRYRGGGPAEHGSETSTNNCGASTQVHVVGNVSTECVNVLENLLVEGRDDIMNIQQAPQQRMRNGMHDAICI